MTRMMSWAPVIDTHYHLTEPEYADIVQEIIHSLPQAGIENVIVPGYDAKSCERAVQLKLRFPRLAIGVGIHPEFITGNPLELVPFLRRCTVTAIGEIGLDTRRGKPEMEQQVSALRTQLRIADEYDKPVIIHCVKGHQRLLEILSDFPDLRGVLHRVSCSWEIAKQYLKMGYYLGIGPDLFNVHNNKLKSVVRLAPLDRIVIETDAPFTRGFIYGKSKPPDLKAIILAISRLRDVEPAELSRRIYRNTHDLFDLEALDAP